MINGQENPTLATDIATNIGAVAEDSAHSSGQAGVPAWTVRKDTASALAGADADYQPLITDANGRLHTAFPGADSTNGLVKITRKNTRAAAAPITATGTHFTGAGTLERLIVANNHATTTSTLSVYDNTAASGEKIIPDISIKAESVVEIEVNAPFAIGLHFVIASGTFSGYAYVGPVIV